MTQRHTVVVGGPWALLGGGASGEVRIGEVATWAGVTPRTVRHYHRIGLLPEPPRSSSGYRDYGMADLVRLLRVRRLAELGVRLDDVKDVVSEAQPLALPDRLDELECHLSAQEQRIAEQRKRLRQDAARPPLLRGRPHTIRAIAAGAEHPGPQCRRSRPIRREDRSPAPATAPPA